MQQGHKVAKFQGYKVTTMQGYKVARLQSSKVTKLKGKVARLERLQRYLVATLQGDRSTGFDRLQGSKDNNDTWCERQARKEVSKVEEQKTQKEDRFLQGRQIAYLIFEYFLVIGANDSVENYADILQLLL